MCRLQTSSPEAFGSESKETTRPPSVDIFIVTEWKPVVCEVPVIKHAGIPSHLFARRPVINKRRR